MLNGFDWEIIHRCQYEIDLEYGCGEPATHKVWWEDMSDAMMVCPKHFEFIKQTEVRNNKRRKR